MDRDDETIFKIQIIVNSVPGLDERWREGGTPMEKGVEENHGFPGGYHGRISI